MIAAMILAAGESQRMNIPKALLRIGSETFAECIARKARQAGAGTVYLVAGHHHNLIKEKLKGKLELDIIFNYRYKEGQLSSLKEGLRNLATGSTEILVWPVDQPLVTLSTVQVLLESYRRNQKHVTIPVFQSKHGHPVLYDAVAIHSVLGLSSTKTARELLKIYESEIDFVNVEDQGVVLDIDTLEDYRKYVTDAGL
jgi:molybdenum cofactor cytidylyltransferase